VTSLLTNFWLLKLFSHKNLNLSVENVSQMTSVIKNRSLSDSRQTIVILCCLQTGWMDGWIRF